MKRKLKITFNSPVILGFVAVCFVVTLIGMISGGAITQALFMTYHSSLTNPMTYIRFFTHVFGHDGWSHFMGNATYLLLLGTILEDRYGSKVIVEIMLITALITALVNYIFFANVALCGASGIVFAFILLASFTGFSKGEIPLTFILIAVIFIGQQMYEGFVLNDNISNLSHIIGGVIGAAAGYFLNVRHE